MALSKRNPSITSKGTLGHFHGRIAVCHRIPCVHPLHGPLHRERYISGFPAPGSVCTTLLPEEMDRGTWLDTTRLAESLRTRSRVDFTRKVTCVGSMVTRILVGAMTKAEAEFPRQLVRLTKQITANQRPQIGVLLGDRLADHVINRGVEVRIRRWQTKIDGEERKSSQVDSFEVANELLLSCVHFSIIINFSNPQFLSFVCFGPVVHDANLRSFCK